MKKKVLLLLLLTVMLVPSTVLAIDAPDTPVSIEQVVAYRHALELNDRFYTVLYRLNYAAIPSIPASKAYILTYSDEGPNGGPIESVVPVDFNNSGYGYGLMTIYRSATEAETWKDSDLTFTLSGNPTQAWSASPPTVSSNNISWRSLSTLALTQASTSAGAIALARILEKEWGVDIWQGIQSESGFALTTTGSAYFISVQGDYSVIAPDAFLSVTQSPSLDESGFSLLASSASAGTSSIKLASLKGFEIGQVVQIVDPSNCRGETHEIENLDTDNNLTFLTPLTNSYTTANGVYAFVRDTATAVDLSKFWEGTPLGNTFSKLATFLNTSETLVTNLSGIFVMFVVVVIIQGRTKSASIAILLTIPILMIMVRTGIIHPLIMALLVTTLAFIAAYELYLKRA